MKRAGIISLLLTLIFTLGFYEIVLGDGGGWEIPPACQKLPAPDSGPYLKGTFTSAYDQSNPDRYDIHVVLEKEEKTFGCAKSDGGVKHLFSFQMVKTTSSKPMCKYESSELKEKYKYAPCMSKVGEKYNLQGIPVLTELAVTQQENCGDTGDTPEAMIYGTIKIRIVPSQSK